MRSKPPFFSSKIGVMADFYSYIGALKLIFDHEKIIFAAYYDVFIFSRLQ